MANIQEQLAAKRGKGSFNKLTSGFDVNTSFVTDVINEAAFLPKKIEFSKLRVSPYNTYGFSDDEISELADSILRLGMLDYLIVEKAKDDNYDILSGQKRFMAISKIKENSQENFEKVFPNNSIPCRIIDLEKLCLFGMDDPYEISEDTKRTFIIAAGNQQHEKTVKDYMLQVEQLNTVYAEMKEKGLTDGQRKREFVAEHTNIQSRSAQKVINAMQHMMPELWNALKGAEELNSITLLEKISELPNDKQNILLVALLSKQEHPIASVFGLKDMPASKPTPASHFEDTVITSASLSQKLHINELTELSTLDFDEITLTEKDRAKLEDISQKIEKLQNTTAKLLKKYKKKKR